MANVYHIHVGKCAGGTINKVLNQHGVTFTELHCGNAAVELESLLMEDSGDNIYLISNRDPIERYISCFNWEKYEKVYKNKSNNSHWKELLTYFKNANELAEALESNDKKSKRLAEFAFSGSKLHFQMSLSWYLTEEALTMLPIERTFLVRTEELISDLAFFLSEIKGERVVIDELTKDKNSDNYLDLIDVPEPHYLSSNAVVNLKKVYFRDYDIHSFLEDNISVEAKVSVKSIIKSGVPKSSDRLWGDDVVTLREGLENIKSTFFRQKVESFYKNGYCIFENALDDKTCDFAKDSYVRWFKDNASYAVGVRKDGKPPRIVNLHSELDEIKALFTKNKQLLFLVDLLFGYKSSVYTSLTFMYGTEQPLHRDTPVFRTSPEEFYFGFWVALEDSDETNGCLRALPGAHRGGRVDPFKFAEGRLDDVDCIDINGSGLWTPYQNEVVTKCLEEGFEPKLIKVNKGDVVLWHPQLPHGGSKINEQSRTRASVVFHVVPERVPVHQADVFFNRKYSKGAPKVNKTYYEYSGREFMQTSKPTFGKN